MSNNLVTNSNIVLDCFINSLVCEDIIDEATADKMRCYQIVVVKKDSFANRFKSFFGFTDDSDEDSQKFVCVKVCGYTVKKDDEEENEDDDNFMRRIGIK